MRIFLKNNCLIFLSISVAADLKYSILIFCLRMAQSTGLLLLQTRVHIPRQVRAGIVFSQIKHLHVSLNCAA